jgi:hypothetical protein
LTRRAGRPTPCAASRTSTPPPRSCSRASESELILATGYPGLDLLPADFSYRNFAVHLAARRHPTERLLKMSRPLREIYAALFLDCPAGISLLSENVLRAADVVIVPLVPTPLSLRMLRQLLDFIAREGWRTCCCRSSPWSMPPRAAPGADYQCRAGVSADARDRGCRTGADRTCDAWARRWRPVHRAAPPR